MTRLMLAAGLVAALAASAGADPPVAQPAPQPQAANQGPPPGMQRSGAHPLLHRFRYSSYGVWVRTMGPGYPAYRYTYAGQKDNFPLPAIFQSGMEHNNWTYGVGF